MKYHLVVLTLLVFLPAFFSSDLLAQSRVRSVKNQIEQAKDAALRKIPKVPQVSPVPMLHVQPDKGKTSVIRKFKSTALDLNVPNSFLSEKNYRSTFVSLSENSAATGEDYLQLYYTMGCDSLYLPIGNDLEYKTVADKYLDIDSPTPERLAEVLAIARQQFPKQRHINLLQTPSAFLIERATQRYYSQILAADSTFTYHDATILSKLYHEYRHQLMNNEGIILYYYLTGMYEYAIPALERYFKIFEKFSVSNHHLNIKEIAPKICLLKKCYEATGLSERRDSLLASPIYQRIIEFEATK